jgi:hypothetical protein
VFFFEVLKVINPANRWILAVFPDVIRLIAAILDFFFQFEPFCHLKLVVFVALTLNSQAMDFFSQDSLSKTKFSLSRLCQH